MNDPELKPLIPTEFKGRVSVTEMQTPVGLSPKARKSLELSPQQINLNLPVKPLKLDAIPNKHVKPETVPDKLEEHAGIRISMPDLRNTFMKVYQKDSGRLYDKYRVFLDSLRVSEQSMSYKKVQQSGSQSPVFVAEEIPIRHHAQSFLTEKRKSVFKSERIVTDQSITFSNYTGYQSKKQEEKSKRELSKHTLQRLELLDQVNYVAASSESSDKETKPEKTIYRVPRSKRSHNWRF